MTKIDSMAKAKNPVIKKTVSILVVFLILATIGAYMYLQQKTASSDQTDAEIRKELFCERMTADVRGTDYYCTNLDLYRKDKAANNLLDENWSRAQDQLKARGLPYVSH